MFPFQDSTISFCITIFWSDVYKNWHRGDPDNQLDAAMFHRSLLAVGLKPVRCVVSMDGIELWFATWAEMSEADKALRKVLDLLWLID